MKVEIRVPVDNLLPFGFETLHDYVGEENLHVIEAPSKHSNRERKGE